MNRPLIHAIGILLLSGPIAFFCESALAQGPVIEWQRFAGEDAKYRMEDIIVCRDGGFAMTGDLYTPPGAPGKSGAFLLKTDASGAKMVDVGFTTATLYIGNALAQGPDGGFVLAGWIIGGSACAIKTDANGEVEWRKTYGDSESLESFASVDSTTDGGYILAGSSHEKKDAITTRSLYLVRVDAEGEMVWERTFSPNLTGGLNHEVYYVDDVLESPDGGFVVAGAWWADPRPRQSCMWKISASGTLEWVQVFGPTNDYYSFSTFSSVENADGGGYVAAGSVAVFSEGSELWPPSDGYLVKVSASGALEWERTINLSEVSDGFSSIARAEGGGYLLSGSVYSMTTTKEDTLAAQVDATGKVLWSNIFPYSHDARGVGFYPTPDGGAILGSKVFTKSGVRPWLVKLRLDASLPCWVVY